MSEMKDVAKKTLAKIEKEQAKLDSLIAKRDEYNAMVQAKLAEMNDEIKKQEKVLAGLREQEKAEKLDAVASLMGQSGISVDDLLKAAAKGDLYAIQEMLENKGKAPVNTGETATNEPVAENTNSENTALPSYEPSDLQNHF